jgi:hypothetical protein
MEEEQVIAQIKEYIKKIRYGAIEIVIHDSKIVQIEAKEKIRFAEKIDRTRQREG